MIVPKRKHYRVIPTPNFYSSIEFILAREVQLLAFVPPKAYDDFLDRFREATGRLPYPDEPGLVLHPEGTNKYWHECRITFNAQEHETWRLFLGDDLIVKGSDDTHWNINNNDLFFELLRLGFRLGSQQDKASIESAIPNQYLEAFKQGYSRGLKNT